MSICTRCPKRKYKLKLYIAIKNILQQNTVDLFSMPNAKPFFSRLNQYCACRCSKQLYCSHWPYDSIVYAKRHRPMATPTWEQFD